jgi:hypothetical protein
MPTRLICTGANMAFVISGCSNRLLHSRKLRLEGISSTTISLRWPPHLFER